MRTVLFLTLLLAVFFATMITAVLLDSRRLVAAPIGDLPFSDCRLPCFAGAIIGQTRVEDAISQMGKRFEPRGYQFERRIWSETTIGVNWRKTNVSNISVTFTREVLNAVGVSIDPDDKSMPRLGELVAALGQPSCISTNRKAFFNVYYFDKRYILTIAVTALKMDQRIQWITVETISKPIYLQVVANPNCASVFAQDWHGFTDARYQ